MRSKASKRSLSTRHASTGEPDEDERSNKRVRWDPKSDDEMGTVTASDDSEGTGEGRSAISDDEKVHSFLHHRPSLRSHVPGARS